jgi:hypothetical protein
MFLTCCPVRFEFTERIKATTPAAFGQAEDVPLKSAL